MFYCFLLNQFVCIHKVGKISEIDYIVVVKKRSELSINAMALHDYAGLMELDSPFAIRFLALRPSI